MSEEKVRTLEDVQKDYAQGCMILGDKTYRYEQDKAVFLSHLFKLNQEAKSLGEVNNENKDASAN